MKTRNIMIVGVGGQGSLLASKLLGHLLMEQGYDVKVSEVHGMSQRGGSVVTYVRYGDKVNSPVIDKGEADYIISFELLEAARWLSYLKPDGQILTSTQQIDPMPVRLERCKEFHLYVSFFSERTFQLCQNFHNVAAADIGDYFVTDYGEAFDFRLKNIEKGSAFRHFFAR